jgi:cytoskeleton protein RodZ
MKITGQILKENRERKGISINDVAHATKIGFRTIQAIENGDLEHLPPKTFLRGFVRAYATYLELDVDDLLKTFLEEMGSTNPKAAISDEVDLKVKGGSDNADAAINPKTSMPMTIGAIAGILLLVVLIVYFKGKMESYEKESIVEKNPHGIESLTTPTPGTNLNALAVPSASPSPTASSSPSAAPDAVAPSATPIASAVPLATPEPSATVAPTATPRPTPAATATATPTPRPTATPTPEPTATPTPKPTPTPRPTPTPTPNPKSTPAATATPAVKPAKIGKIQEVIVEALDVVEVSAKIDGEPATKIKLTGDQVQTFKVKRRVTLDFSDGGAVNLIVNGVDRGVPGDLGKPKHLELP